MIARVEDWGQVPYQQAWDRQLGVYDVVSGGGLDTLVLVEHPPILTLGANFHDRNLRYPIGEYGQFGIEVVRTDRGGDVTFHGPGQIVIYPVFDLTRHGRDLHRWMRDLEETQLRVLASYGIDGRRFPPHTGAWVGDEKVAAIGVKVRRWVSFHGIALNVNNGSEGFEHIVPCGIEDYGVTSLCRILGELVSLEEVKSRILTAFSDVFGLTFDDNS